MILIGLSRGGLYAQHSGIKYNIETLEAVGEYAPTHSKLPSIHRLEHDAAMGRWRVEGVIMFTYGFQYSFRLLRITFIVDNDHLNLY